MRTVVLRVSPDSPEPAQIAQAAAVLRAGGLVVFPTETVYGLGANALDARAVGRIFEAKGRPANNPIIIHVADASAAALLVAEWPERAARLADRFWPGPLTLVLPKGPQVPDVVTAGGPTVAIRVPAHPVALALLRAAGVPIAAPSANRSSRLSSTHAKHVLADLDGRIEMILDAGPTAVGLESTVLDLTTTPPQVLRPGHITPSEIEQALGDTLSQSGDHVIQSAEPLPSPGLLPRHYAPRTPLDCCEKDQLQQIAALQEEHRRIACLKLEGTAIADGPNFLVISLPADPVRYGARLYDELHKLDAAGVDLILVEVPPAEEAWLAVRDRLKRMRRKWGEKVIE